MNVQTREIDYEVVATGLEFPEGPIAMPDGSVVLVEIVTGKLTRVDVSDGSTETVADCGGGPNGAALGPDGAIYVCNNGGYFSWFASDGVTIPGPTPEGFVGGTIQRVDPSTGAVDVVYDSCDGSPLVAPNDLVFDDHGGFWFTDHGVQHGEHSSKPGVLYALADGSRIEAKVHGTNSTNGVGLSPAGDRLWVAETHTGDVWGWSVPSPGSLERLPSGTISSDVDPGGTTVTAPEDGTLAFSAAEGVLFDSLAVDGEGWVCVATIGQGGITCVSPDGSAVEKVPLPDPLVTNICFGGEAHGSSDYRTAYATGSSSGVLYRLDWPRPGLALPG